jgi:hypothetical protein
MTPIEVANLALAALDLDPITSLEDDGDRAKSAKAHWDVCRRAFLSEHPWAFAKRTARLAERPGTGGGWKHGYSCPADFLSAPRLLERGAAVPFEIAYAEGGLVVRTDAGEAELEFVGDAADLSPWTPAALEALSRRLAFVIGQDLKRNAQEQRELWEEYQYALARAAGRDAEWRTYPPLSAGAFNASRLIFS